MAKLFVSTKDESPRIFKSDILDFISRVHWSVPLLFWTPAVLYCIYHSLFVYGLDNYLYVVGAFVAAFFAWTLAEYILHRFVFHYHPTSKIGQRLHFVMHGVHHDFPNDSKRLVMPPVLSVLIGIPFFLLFYFTMGQYHLIFFAGFTCGYLSYDMIHYATHHAQWENRYFRRLKEHHMIHHYHSPERGYSVSNTFWDIIFGTKLNVDKKNTSVTSREMEHQS